MHGHRMRTLKGKQRSSRETRSFYLSVFLRQGVLLALKMVGIKCRNWVLSVDVSRVVVDVGIFP